MQGMWVPCSGGIPSLPRPLWCLNPLPQAVPYGSITQEGQGQGSESLWQSTSQGLRDRNLLGKVTQRVSRNPGEAKSGQGWPVGAA